MVSQLFTKSRDIRNQFRFKNKERKDPAEVVYEVNCNDCTKMYIGETGHKSKERIKEHKSENITGLSQNMKETWHEPASENMKIIY